MSDSIALVVTTHGEFRVVASDQWNQHRIVAQSFDLQQCLEMGALNIGFPIAIPITKADT